MRNYVHTFKEYAEVKRIKVKSRQSKAPAVRCKACGAPMNKVEGTNIFVCTGKVTKTNKDSGESFEVPCGHFYLSR